MRGLSEDGFEGRVVDASYRPWARRLGLVPLPGVPLCPRTIVGIACTFLEDEDLPCDCEDLTIHLLDHARVWISSGDLVSLTSEPYDLFPEDVAPLVAVCDRLGLNFRISGESPWLTGKSVLVHMRKEAV